MVPMSHNLFNDDFGSAKPALAGAIALLFGGALLFLSAVTSAAFFFSYAPNVFDFLTPSLSPYLAALTGVLCFELASVAWSWLRAHDADTAVQLAAANVGAWGAMIGGLVVTAVYFALNSSLLSGRLDDTAVMTVSIMGGLLIIIGIGGNFALGFVYRNAGAKHIEASNTAELRAMQSTARHAAARESTAATLAKTLEEIRRSLPAASQTQGSLNAGQFLDDNFTRPNRNTAESWPYSLVDLARDEERKNGRPTHRPGI